MSPNIEIINPDNLPMGSILYTCIMISIATSKDTGQSVRAYIQASLTLYLTIVAIVLTWILIIV